MTVHDTGPIVQLDGAVKHFRVGGGFLRGGPVSFNSVLVEVDQESGRATGIQRVDRTVEADG